MSMQSFSNILPTGRCVYTIFDMSSEDLQEVESRLRPGKYSNVGFLSKEENLVTVCQKDLTTLSNLGISCAQISYTLSWIVKQFLESFKGNRDVIIANKFTVTVDGHLGDQPCPFHKKDSMCHVGESQNFSIVNVLTNERINVTDLVIDLIGKHAFFEGGTEYRIDPEKVCRVLELKPGDFMIEIKEIWHLVSTSGSTSLNEEESAKKHAKKTVQINDFSTAYFGLNYKDGRNDKKSPSEASWLDEYIVPALPKSTNKEAYCHLFNRQNCEGTNLILEGIELDTPITSEGLYVFALRERTHCTSSQLEVFETSNW